MQVEIVPKKDVCPQTIRVKIVTFRLLCWPSLQNQSKISVNGGDSNQGIERSVLRRKKISSSEFLLLAHKSFCSWEKLVSSTILAR